LDVYFFAIVYWRITNTVDLVPYALHYLGYQLFNFFVKFEAGETVM